MYFIQQSIIFYLHHINSKHCQLNFYILLINKDKLLSLIIKYIYFNKILFYMDISNLKLEPIYLNIKIIKSIYYYHFQKIILNYLNYNHLLFNHIKLYSY